MGKNALDIKAFLSDPKNLNGLLPDSFSISSVIRSGGQGIVYRGGFEKKDSAIKIYFPGQNLKRVQREVDALATLNCPNIVELLGYLTIDVEGRKLPVVATAHVDGYPLDQIEETFTEKQAYDLARDVTIAISAMWQKRIVHRDIKPSNLIIRPNGGACVIDLGLARHVEKSTLTVAGATWGTIGYLSPEQARAQRELTCKSDIFSLGIVILESVMGGHPTDGDQDELLDLDFHLNLPGPVSGWRISEIVSKMLSPRPTGRPTPNALLDSLQRA